MAADPCTAIEYWRSGKPRCMGTLYWRLNDTWPVASCSSLEYGGGDVVEIAPFEASVVADTALLHVVRSRRSHLPVVQMPVVRSLAG